jgi:hypothetical protein
MKSLKEVGLERELIFLCQKYQWMLAAWWDQLEEK